MFHGERLTNRFPLIPLRTGRGRRSRHHISALCPYPLTTRADGRAAALILPVVKGGALQGARANGSGGGANCHFTGTHCALVISVRET